MTVNAIQNEHAVGKDISLTQQNILVDPLQVLRCDTRVYRCAPILQIILRMLHASLAASKIQLTRHMLDKPLVEKSGQLTSEAEREELRIALVASQESLGVQVLLEACIENEQDCINPGQKWALREIRSLICSHLHQVFIADPSLVKLIHFQGYPRELIGMAMRGIPSMHICLDFIPELLSQSCMEKQIFAIDLISHLSLQYALPKSMSIARLCINTLSTLLGALSSDTIITLFRNVLPCLVRICEAFPPLIEDVISLLMQLGRVVESQASLGRITAGPKCGPHPNLESQNLQELKSEELSDEIQDTVSEIFKKAVLKSNLLSVTETTKGNAKLTECVMEQDLLQFTNLNENPEECVIFSTDLNDDSTDILSSDSESESEIEFSFDEHSMKAVFNLTDLFKDSENVDENKSVPQSLKEIMNFFNEDIPYQPNLSEINKFDIIPPELTD